MESIDVAQENMPPDRITFTCVPYLGLQERKFEMRLGINRSEGGVSLMLQIIQQEATEEEMVEEFVGIIRTKLSEISPAPDVYTGNFQM